MIDKSNGNIKLTDSLELNPKSNFKLLEELNLGEVHEVLDMGNTYKWLNFKNIKIENEYFIISLCFSEEKLTEISMLVNDKRFELSSSWDSWSEQKEKENLKKYQNWLGKELGKKLKFDWGDACAVYDPKSGSSSIRIRYK